MASKKKATRTRPDGGRACRKVYELLRSKLGDDISDRAIARRLGMEWKSFAGLKHGQRQLPRLGELERMARLVDLDPIVLFQVALGREPLPRGGAGAAGSALRARIERVAQPLFTVDTSGLIHDVNAPFCAAVGRAEPQLVGQSLFDLVAPEATSQALALIAAISRGELVASAELVLCKPSGGAIVLEIDASPLLDDARRPIGAQAIGRDVSAERQFSRQLNQQRQTLQVLWERLPAACVVFDAARRIVAANPSIERVCQVTAAEAIGRTQADVFGAPAPTCPVSRAFATGRPAHQVAWVTNRSGERVYVHRTAGPISDGGGKVERVVEILVDVTDEVRHGDLRVLSLWRGSHDAAPATTLSAERRRMPRAEVAFSAQLSHGQHTKMVHVENLGSEGLFVRTDLKLAKGTEIELQWLLPTDRVPVRARAVVAWLRPARKDRRGGFGVRFVQLAPRDAHSSTGGAA